MQKKKEAKDTTGELNVTKHWGARQQDEEPEAGTRPNYS